MVKHSYNYACTCGTDCHDEAAIDINKGQVMGRPNDRMIFFTINIIPIIFSTLTLDQGAEGIAYPGRVELHHRIRNTVFYPLNYGSICL